MPTIKLEITAKGGIQMLHDDAVNLAEFGRVEVKRASHVEYNNEVGEWYVASARTGIILKDDFKTRAEALAWEKEYFSPGGAGWSELTTEEK